MKKLASAIIALIALATLDAAAARPESVGRRGGAGGVENTAQAFRTGAQAGYDYLECHVRLTADSVFVACHDGKTNRLGGRMKVDRMPLDSLRTEVYTQTRENGVTYTDGCICTVAEFLDICRDTGVRPMLHLKKIAGINDTDCSMLPALVDLVGSRGLLDSCVILSSMKGPVEFLQQHYPALKLCFQADDKWAETFDWTVARGLDVDIKKECLTPEVIARYHDKGLKVTTWTVNDPDEHRSLTEAGVDRFISDTLPR